MGMFVTFAVAQRVARSPRFKAGIKAALAARPERKASKPEAAVAQPGRMGSSLRNWLLGAVVVFTAVSIASWVGGLLFARRLTSGDENSDEFQLAAIMAGKEFRSHAANLKSGTAITSLGGMELDLREATLDPTGANLELRTTMGGIEVRVPEYWIVEVDQETSGGGALEIDVPLAEDLPEDAPRLHIHAVTRMGGGLVTARTD